MSERCNFTLKSGPRAGLKCGVKAVGGERLCSRHRSSVPRLLEQIHRTLQDLSHIACPQMARKLQDYIKLLAILTAPDSPTDMRWVAQRMLKIVGKAIHAENYPTISIFLQYLALFFDNLRVYLTKYDSIARKREQDIDAYQRLCEHWFIESTPCFELLSEQIVVLTHNLQPRTEEKIDPGRIDFQNVLRAEPFQLLDKAFRKSLRHLVGELFFIRLTRNFQIFLCRLFNGACLPASQTAELRAIERAYTAENLYSYLTFAEYFGAFKELDDIDFPDELEARLSAHDIDFASGVDYDLYRICCED